MIQITAILEIIINIALISEIIPLIFCILFYKKFNTKILEVFFVYAILQALFIVLISVNGYVYRSLPTNNLLLRFHLVFEYTLIAYLLSLLIVNKTIKKLLVYSILPFFAYNLLDFLSYGNLEFSNTPTIVEFLIFIVFIIIFFFEKMQNDSKVLIYNTASFWICVGLFVYCTGNFFYILLVENFKNASIDSKNQLKIIYSIVTILKNVILGLSLMSLNFDDKTSEDNLQFPSDLNLDAFTPNHKLN